MGNIWLPENRFNELIHAYINVSDEIVIINLINENVMQRLNGADFDSDSVLLTDDSMFIKLAKRNYQKFKVPTAYVESRKIKRRYTKQELCDLDVKTNVNKIGEIVNLSQELNSLLWHNMNNSIECDFSSLYLDICKLAIMSGCEIDKAKKEFDIDILTEMNAIRAMYLRQTEEKGINKKSKPKFLGIAARNNGYKPQKGVDYKYYDTAMDYLQRVINRAYYGFYSQHAESEKLSLYNIIDKGSIKAEKICWKRQKRLLDIVDICKKDVVTVHKCFDTAEAVREEVGYIVSALINRLSKWDLNKATRANIIKNAECAKNDMFLLICLVNVDSFRELFNKKHGADADKQNAIFSLYGVKNDKTNPELSEDTYFI
jgi:hypothetical protein